MSGDLEGIVRELKARQDIWDCLMRYCRGMDRLDRDLLASAYHPDAIDDHGHYCGPVEGFMDWAMPIYAEHKHVSHHEITNFTCEIDGDTAHVESYWLSTSINKAAPAVSQAQGRYVDRFERRDGAWKIADRVCLVEISENRDADVATLTRRFEPRDRTDVSYARPFVNPRD